MPDEEDVTRDSSTATPEVESQNVGSAANDTQPETKTPEAAATETSTSGSVEPPNEISSKAAIEFLVGKKKTDKSTDEKPATKEKTPKEPEEKQADKPSDGLSDEERKTFGRKAQKRIQDLHREKTEAQAKLKDYEPKVKQGEAFGKVVEQYALHDDLAHVDDKQIAGTIKFQAAVARAFNKQATREDISYIQAQFAGLDKVREAFGIEFPKSEPNTAAVSADDIQSAISSLKKDFDFGPLEKLLERVKTPAKRDVKTTERTAQPLVEQPIQQPRPINHDVTTYSAMLQRDISADGVKNTQEYMTKELWPLILKDIQADYPGKNPVNVYSDLSGRAQYDLAVRAHAEVQKKSASLKTSETPAKRPAVKPVQSGRTPMGAPPQGGTVRAAINFLSGKE